MAKIKDNDEKIKHLDMCQHQKSNTKIFSLLISYYNLGSKTQEPPTVYLSSLSQDDPTNQNFCNFWYLKN